MIRTATQWRTPIYIGLVLLLLPPAAATQVTDEVGWDATDFLVFGALIFGAAAAFEFVARVTRTVWAANGVPYRVALGIALATAVFLVMANGAVGLIGDEGHPANLMYAGVLAVGLAGALGIRFRPRGMAHTLVVVAAAQVLVATVALIAGWGSDAPSWPRGVVFATGLFTALWLGAAALFFAASRE